jgi:hypothetical protein
VQGYLVYKFFTMNAGSQAGYITIVDEGNGEVLHTSETASQLVHSILGSDTKRCMDLPNGMDHGKHVNGERGIS